MQFRERDGVRLYFERARGPNRPVVLIHGWCCDYSYLAPQFEHYSRAGHDVVSVDLRGHGLSDKPRERYTMQLFADDMAFVCERLALQKPVLIGHSMGGIVAFDLASRYPALPAALVMLDAAIVMPEEARAGILALLSQLRGPNYREIVRELVAKSLMLSTDDAERRERILVGMSSAEQHVMVSTVEALRDYDAAPAASRIVAPSLYVAADEPHMRSDMTRLRQILPNMFFGQTVGSGHFCQLEVPDQVNAMIDRFLAVALTPSTG